MLTGSCVWSWPTAHRLMMCSSFRRGMFNTVHFSHKIKDVWFIAKSRIDFFTSTGRWLIDSMHELYSTSKEPTGNSVSIRFLVYGCHSLSHWWKTHSNQYKISQNCSYVKHGNIQHGVRNKLNKLYIKQFLLLCWKLNSIAI